MAGGEHEVGRVDDAEHGDDEEEPGDGRSEAYMLSHLSPTCRLFVSVFNLNVLTSHGRIGF